MTFLIEHRGEFSALAAALLWAGSLCLFRHFGEGVPAAVLNLFKSAIAVVGLSVMLLINPPEMPTQQGDWWALATSGLVGLAIGDTALFLSLKRLGVQSSTAIQCLAPPMTVGLAYLTLGEMLGSSQMIGLVVTVVAVLGVVVLGRRGNTRLSMLPRRLLWGGIALSVLSAACQAGGIVLSRQAFQRVDVVFGTFIRFLPSVVVLLALEIAKSGLPSPRRWFSSRKQAWMLAVAGFCGTFLGVLCYSVATKYTEPGVVLMLL